MASSYLAVRFTSMFGCAGGICGCPCIWASACWFGSMSASEFASLPMLGSLTVRYDLSVSVSVFVLDVPELSSESVPVALNRYICLRWSAILVSSLVTDT